MVLVAHTDTASGPALLVAQILHPGDTPEVRVIPRDTVIRDQSRSTTVSRLNQHLKNANLIVSPRQSTWADHKVYNCWILAIIIIMPLPAVLADGWSFYGV